MSGPPMDELERALEAMSEPTPEPTQLWRRALEVARAEERASLVHPKADLVGGRGGRSGRGGRRLLIGLNAVGVAAMVALASGVWWMAMQPRAAGSAGVGAGASELAGAPQAHPTPEAEPMELAMAETMASPEPDRNLAADTQRSAGGFEDATRDDAELFDAGSPTRMKPKARLRRSDDAADVEAFTGDTEPAGDEIAVAGSAMKSVKTESIETVDITVEVDDADSAFVAISSLPEAEFDEFGAVADEPGVGGTRSLTLNIRPERVPEVIESIGGLGRVEMQDRRPESRATRAEADLRRAAAALSPGLRELEQVLGEDGSPLDHRAQHELGRPENVQALGRVRRNLRRALDWLEAARQSLDLSRIHVLIRERTQEP